MFRHDFENLRRSHKTWSDRCRRHHPLTSTA